jgi:hypothetical protein
MTTILEVDQDGLLRIPSGLIGNPKPHARFVAEVEGERVVLRPQPAFASSHAWFSTTPTQRVEAIRSWLNKDRPPAPALSDEALRRENLYE